MHKQIDKENRKKLEALNNPKAIEIINHYIDLCKPDKVTVITDSKKEKNWLRKKAVEAGEEAPLKMHGHTIHYDSYYDQARDKDNTRVLLPKGKKLSEYIETLDRDDGLADVMQILDGIMRGKEMLVLFFCLGPVDSKFSIAALQITDSYYVGHSEDILYRPGYEMFKKLNGSEDFFHFIHSAGRLENNVCIDIDKRRIFMDLEENRVFTVNNQYAGNSVGLKKLALRLAINKSNKEDWLCEHMFITGIRDIDGKRTTYFTGAFPSLCGKTSTAMLPGNTIVGDDIAYLRPGEDGFAYAANVEQGIFGVIMDINEKDDLSIYKALTTEREVIFNNVLINDGMPYWIGMGREAPDNGVNHSGEWIKGKKDKAGNEISISHKNARFTLRINELDNADPVSDDPKGVPIHGIIYGGRDSDTNVPVCQSLGWAHGVFIGATIESETTAATLGKEGDTKHDPMANIDFLVVPLGLYIKNHLKFGEDLALDPTIFATNYFLKGKDGKFLNDKTDKKVWLIWMEGRVHEDYKAIETPVGLIPLYDDLKELFSKSLKKKYSKKEYEHQFSIRIPNLLKRLDRLEAIFKREDDIPEMFFIQLDEQRQRLNQARKKHGKDVISPFDFQ
ncbi:MAG: phosphoenolpyruvate carboxykinase (GTP) [Candidatus Woesearchaeota archaeon]